MIMAARLRGADASSSFGWVGRAVDHRMGSDPMAAEPVAVPLFLNPVHVAHLVNPVHLHHLHRFRRFHRIVREG
jgi:hypothetical protein